MSGVLTPMYVCLVPCGSLQMGMGVQHGGGGQELSTPHAGTSGYEESPLYPHGGWLLPLSHQHRASMCSSLPGAQD